MTQLKTYIAYLKNRKKYWLLPAILMMVIIGFVVVSSAGSVFAPFIYTIF